MQRAALNTARTSGVVLAALALAISARWLLPGENVTHWVPGSQGVGVFNPLLFLTLGLLLLAAAGGRRSEGRWSRAPTFGIVVLLVLPALHLFETLSGMNLGLDPQGPGNLALAAGRQYPGRLSPNSSIAFIAAGVALLLLRRPPTPARTRARLVATTLVALIGLAGLAGHFLGLETLYQLANHNRLLPATALGFVVASIGLWSLHEAGQVFELRDAARRIQRRSLAVVTLLCVAAGVAGFASLRDTFEETISKSLLQTATNNATSLAHALDVALWYPKTLSTRPSVQQGLERLTKDAGDEAAKAALQNIADSFLKADLGDAALYNAQGQLVASGGRPMQGRAQVVHALLNTGQNAVLAWNEAGYYLVADNPVVVHGQVVGRLKTEQPLQLVNQLMQQMRQADATSDAVLCSRDDGAALCAATRFRAPSFRLPLDAPRGVAAHGIGRALAGETGVLLAKDPRDVDVLTAFAPLGDYGLALGYKTDLDTLYAPLKSRVAMLVGAMLLLVGLAVFALLSQVQPVLMRLVDNERQLKAILDEQEELVSLARPDGTLTYVNPSYARHFGLREDELLGRNLLAHVFPDDRAVVEGKIARVLATGVSERSENRMLAASGAPRWVSWTNNRQRGPRGEPLLHSVGRDVTERRAAEEALRASEAVLERTGSVAGVGGWELNLRTGVLNWTRQTRAIHGVAEDYVPTLERAISFYAPQGRELIAAAIERGARDGTPWDLELPLVTADGREISVRAQGHAEFEHGKPVRLVGALQDVSARKALEISLRELTDIFENTTDFVIQTDRHGNLGYLNPAARRTLGLGLDEPLAGRRFSDFNTAQTNEQLATTVIPAVKAHGIWVGETVFKAGDGRLVPVTHMVIGHRDAQGRVSRYSGIMRDITVERAAQREQQRQATTLRAVTEAIPAAVAVVDTDERYRFVNSGFERWVGKTREHIVGHTVQAVLGAADYARSRPWITRALAGETVEFERAYPGLPTRNLSVSYIPMRGENGRVEGFIGIAQDVTRHREEQLRLLTLSQRDALTGLLNRAGFEEFMEGLERSGDGAGHVALLYVDLDHFKPVNDHHGHPVGDQLLQQFAQRLLGTVRPTDAVARLGGDEFAVVLSGIRESANAHAVAEKVVQAARAPFFIEGRELRVGASVGVAVGRDTGEDWRGLVTRADTRLYEAKAEGRGRFA